MEDDDMTYQERIKEASDYASDRAEREDRRMDLWTDGYSFWVRPSDDSADPDLPPPEASVLATWGPEARKATT